jgi:integrase
VRGRVINESAETESRREALDVLKAKMVKYSTGLAADSRKTTVKDVSEGMLKTWRMLEKNPASIEWADRCWRHLLAFFGSMRADEVSSGSIRDYAESRRKQKAFNSTINRELAVMSSGYTIAYNENPRRVAQKLSFSRLAEPAARRGFIEQAQYLKIAAGCKELFMRTMLALSYTFGFRKGELLSLKVSDVDLFGGTVRLRTSKNGEPRQNQPHRGNAQPNPAMSRYSRAGAKRSSTLEDPGISSPPPRVALACFSTISGEVPSGTLCAPELPSTWP